MTVFLPSDNPELFYPMADETIMGQASNISSGVPLTSHMRDLVGFLIHTIDLRSHMLQRAEDEGNTYHPETCTVCNGTGIIMVPPFVAPDAESGDNDDVVTVPDSEDNDDDDFPTTAAREDRGVVQLPSTGAGLVAAARLTAASAAASSSTTIASITPLMTPPPTAPTVAHTASAPAVIVSSLAATAPAVPAPVAPALPAANVAPAALAPGAVSLGPPIPGPAPTAITLPAPAPAVVNATQVQGVPTSVPPASTIIAGFHSLGPNTPPPNPTNAVFTNSGEERYYVVTKGLRVGVFGGWPNTSPYVTGVASASFSRHRTLLSAYEAYVIAWNNGSVAYV
ncbi:hypothetical protein D9611_014720 [Ephemerocybe angulata]|uniref:Ribonuclease H1 N-terminal domain-containing protein n=1 Tax=Ephemerocybe angulata TaxID=980116 RepID=A0A8H5B8S1_9AGAR|nr:hypothetical protein D9611_014720 [Tulosesus angulatus]